MVPPLTPDEVAATVEQARANVDAIERAAGIDPPTPPAPAKRKPGRPRKPAKHGTIRRYRQHLADREPPCDACKAANSAAHREYDASRGVRTGAIGRPRTAECGTREGYNRHLADDEEACDACKAANAARSRDVRATNTTAPSGP